ncbi:MAG TPA: AraC family ligand binding domain-containing protein [Methanoregulaceae archaeon]|nr:AraC family ligand binding domain-containing protein [Methanoregulaceae archaeon]
MECAALSCSVAHAIVPPGEATIPHRLRTATEISSTLSGTGRMHIREDVREIRAGHAVLLPPQEARFIETPGNPILSSPCIVSPPWRADDEELVSQGNNGPLPDNI